MSQELPGGTAVVGRLVSKMEGDFCRLTIAFEWIDANGEIKTGNRKVDYRGYSPSTGNPSRVAQAIAQVNEGAQVYVPVKVKVRDGGQSRKGEPYSSFVVYEALDVLVLDPSRHLEALPA